MRWVRLHAVWLCAILLLVGVASGTAATPLQPDPGPVARADQEDAAPPGPTAAFTLGDCPVIVDPAAGAAAPLCGTIEAPQHHADPATGPALHLGIIRIPATGAERAADPVVVLAGGADGSALDIAARAGELLAAFPGHDLLLMDHRGGRYSTPVLHCDEDDPVRLSEVTSPAGVPFDAHLAAWTACAERLRDAGYDLAAFDATEAALDIADVAAALGYNGPFDLVAIGDGTRAAIAALRAGLPGLRSVTLDSLVPPQVPNTAALARDTAVIVRHLSTACAEDESCSGLLDDLEGGLIDTAANLDLEPAQVRVDDGGASVDVVIDGSGFVRAVVDRFALAPADIDGIPGFIAGLAGSGDPAPIADQILASARDTSRTDALAWALRCSQDLAGATDYALDGVPDAFWPLSVKLADRDGVVEACAAFGVGDAGGTIHDPVASDVPVLALNGEFDPWSPTDAADQARARLTTSYGLVLPAIGHGALLATPCAMSIAGRFVADPSAEPDASCIAEMPEFSTASVEPSPGASTDPGSTTAPDGSPAPSPSDRPARLPKARPVKVGLVKVADGFENANGIVNAGDRRLFVLEQEGYVLVLKPRKDGTFRKAGVFLDIRSRVICCGEKGLLGLAFPPDFAQTGFFYVSFAGTGHTWNLEERRVDPSDPDRADPDYKRRLIRIYKPRDYHWAGDMHFGPDGYLYVTIGDGGFGGGIDDPGDPENRAQDLGVLFGKMLRISPRDGRRDGARYGIPSSNPFLDQRGAQPEIWAYGLRNPWRWSFDRATGDLWIGDVGMWRWEEIDRAKAPRAGKGLNFGWRRMEGPVCYDPPRGCDTGDLTKPFVSLAHTDGVCAVTGGYVYRGDRSPRLRSWYVFADYCSGRLYLLDSAGKRGQKPRVALDTGSQFSALGEGADGEIYVADYGPGNTIYRITGKRP